MKIKSVKVKEFEEVYIDNKKIMVDKYRDYEGYKTIFQAEKIDDDNYNVITGMLDKNMNVIVPIREEVVSEDDYLGNYSKNVVMPLAGKKVLYGYDNNCYLIDLTNAKFDKNNKPLNYIFKFKMVRVIDDENIIIYLPKKSFIYNTKENKFMSKIYNFIKTDENGFNAYLVNENNKYTKPLYIKIPMDYNLNLTNVALLDENVKVMIPKDILNDNNKIIKYCDDCYNSYKEKREDDICKILKQ